MYQFSSAIQVLVSISLLFVVFTHSSVFAKENDDGSVKLCPVKNETGAVIYEYSFQLSSFKIKSDKEKEFITYDITNFTQKCDSLANSTELQVVKLKFNDDELKFNFDFNSTTNKYELKSIELDQKNVTKRTVKEPNLKISSNQFELSHGYKCDSVSFKLEDQQNNTLELELEKVEFAAYVDAKSKSFQSCNKDEETGSSVVPLAVGGALLVFMALALVIYIVVRNRSKN